MATEVVDMKDEEMFLKFKKMFFFSFFLSFDFNFFCLKLFYQEYTHP